MLAVGGASVDAHAPGAAQAARAVVAPAPLLADDPGAVRGRPPDGRERADRRGLPLGVPRQPPGAWLVRGADALGLGSRSQALGRKSPPPTNRQAGRASAECPEGLRGSRAAGPAASLVDTAGAWPKRLGTELTYRKSPVPLRASVRTCDTTPYRWIVSIRRFMHGKRASSRRPHPDSGSDLTDTLESAHVEPPTRHRLACERGGRDRAAENRGLDRGRIGSRVGAGVEGGGARDVRSGHRRAAVARVAVGGSRR